MFSLTAISGGLINRKEKSMPGLRYLDYSDDLKLVKEALRIGNEKPVACIVLGTGFSGLVSKDENRRCPLSSLPGFEDLGELEGHKRELIATEISGRLVVILNGRVHLNESIDNSSHVHVRLQTDILCALGPKLLVLTNSAGRLDPEIKVGGIVVARDFLRSCASTKMPLKAGEFFTPQSAIDCRMKEITFSEIAPKVGLNSYKGCYAFVLGPDIEGEADKKHLKKAGGHVVGMSTLPEACIAAVHGTKVLSISFVSNAENEFSHLGNIARAEKVAKKLTSLLVGVVERI